MSNEGKKIVLNRETGTAQYITEVISREASIEEFIAEYASGHGTRIPLLPENCRGIVSTSRYTGFMVEAFPATRTIRFKSAETYTGQRCLNPGGYTEFTIHLPFMYFLVGVSNEPCTLQGMGLTFATRRVLSLNSDVGFMKFPNFNHQGNNKFPVGALCRGRMNVDDNVELSDCADKFINGVLMSNFNKDYFTPWDAGWGISMLDEAVNKYFSSQAIEAIIKKEVRITNKGKKLEGEERYLDAKTAQEKHSLLFDRAYHLTQHNSCNSLSAYKYMSAWEQLSKDISLEEFVNRLILPKRGAYGVIMEKLQEMVEVL